jgi:hypothetical protein
MPLGYLGESMLAKFAESKTGLWYPQLLEDLLEPIIWMGFQSPVDNR